MPTPKADASNDPLRDLLNFDPLDTAEKLTGESIRAPGMNAAMSLGFVLAHQHAAAKNAVLTERSDTTLNNDLSRYLNIVEGIGFERALEIPFLSYEQNERLFILARQDGLLLCFDTYMGTSVNGGHVYYNWRPSVDALGRCTSSGHFSSKDHTVWVGDHDCREALCYNLDRLSANGDLLSPWVARPFLWLLHHGDTKIDGYNHEAITAERIAMLPQWVRDFIGSED